MREERRTLNVLSIQSEVVRGHVGNGAARFALQRLGIDVWAVPTVVLSNHPGHGKARGEAVPAQRIADLVAGLDDHGWLRRCDGIVSGYLGAADQARAVVDAVRRAKAANPKAVYLCDPVFGDDGGAYAKPGVAEAMARELLPLADIATPNRFELTSLTSKKIDGPKDAVAAARALGTSEVVATSVPFDGGRIGTVVVTASGAWGTAAAKLDNPPHGSGDLFAALYLAARLRPLPPPEALGLAASAVDAVLKASVAAGADELLLVAAQHELAEPAHRLEIVSLA
jgi:pyridoxine kinase